jgi:trk system potassium uptake protein TrkH
LIRRFRSVFRSEEIWTYLGIVAVATFLICANLAGTYEKTSDLIRHGFFQVSSFMTTTGFTSSNFNDWPGLSKTVLLCLMFIGGCAGSTAGGFKVSRIVLLVKNVQIEFRRLLHPRSVGVSRFEGKKVEDDVQKSVGIFLVLYVLCFFAAFILISFDGFDIETNFSAAAACFNNIGPAFGKAAANFDCYSYFSKIILSLAMLLGRLEIWPMILTFIFIPRKLSIMGRKGNYAKI